VHFAFGIFFLFLIILLTLAYPVCIYYAVSGIQRLRRRRIRRLYGADSEKSAKFKVWPLCPHRRLVQILMIISLILVSLYVDQRIKWMGKENAHFKAKEYWVSGQVVAGLRFAATRLLHPDNPILVPFNLLQKAIYIRGIKYLPTVDGEAGVWKDSWLLYPYARKLTLPYLVNPKEKKSSPRMRNLLDQCWWALETMATRPIADKKMRIELYYKNYPRLALYFDTYDGFYAEKYIGSANVLLNRPKHVKKLERLLGWLDQLKTKWEEDGYATTIWEKYPVVEALRSTVRLSILQNLMSAIAFRKEFRCDHPYVKAMHAAMQNFMSDDNRSNSLLNYSRIRHHQAEILYRQHIYSLRSEFCQIILTEICGFSLPDDSLKLITKRDYKKRWSIEAVKDSYREELKLIKARSK